MWKGFYGRGDFFAFRAGVPLTPSAAAPSHDPIQFGFPGVRRFFSSVATSFFLTQATPKKLSAIPKRFAIRYPVGCEMPASLQASANVIQSSVSIFTV